MNQQARVSVVLPCFNAAHFLPAALDSALSQTCLPFEVILVDDGSIDDSASIAESYGPLVRVIRQTNQGESVARNRGIDAARGDLVAFLDADDIWERGKLGRQLSLFTHDIVAVHSSCYYFGDNSGGFDYSSVPEDERYSIEFICLQGAPGYSSSLIVRRDLAVRFPTWTRYGEDMIYVLELLKHGKIALAPEKLVGYRWHKRSQSRRVGIETKWHQTIDRWLSENEAAVGTELVSRIREAYVRRLVERANRCYWNRQLTEFQLLCRHLDHYASSPGLSQLVRRRLYPRFFYAIKDALDTVLTPFTRVRFPTGG